MGFFRSVATWSNRVNRAALDANAIQHHRYVKRTARRVATRTAFRLIRKIGR